MWTTKGQLKDDLIQSLQRESAALRALLSKCGVTLPDSAAPSAAVRRPTTRLTEKSVYHATRETREMEQLRKDREKEPPLPDSLEPVGNSNA